MPRVSASAALTESGDLALALVNLHASEPVTINASIAGYEPVSAVASVLAGESIDAHNTFDDPDAVIPESLAVTSEGGSVVMTLPAHSVAVEPES